MKIDNILQRMWGVRCQQFWQHLLEWRWLDEGNVSHRAWSPAMVVNEQNINVAAHCEPSNPLTATVAKVTTSCRHRTESVTGGSKREMATQCAGQREGGGGWSDLRDLLVAAPSAREALLATKKQLPRILIVSIIEPRPEEGWATKHSDFLIRRLRIPNRRQELFQLKN